MFIRRKIAPFELMSETKTDFRCVIESVMATTWKILAALRGHRARRFTPVGCGNTVCVDFRAERQLEIRLADHRFWLESGERLALRDSHGHRHLLQPGKNVVGVESHNDIVLNQHFQQVSSKHVMVESIGHHRALLTDYSRSGTFIPPQCVV
ncbi:MAG: hypothetical protein CMO26_04040 [Thiotrichales bacterium]|nr:hypothetical protein [Thiotrichales bacterium]|tara:strand:- start:40 stop:495 length:456 start_codon:yes stop_codon:yes gene_type:complete